VNRQSCFGKQKRPEISGKVDVIVTSPDGNILSHLVMDPKSKATLLPYFGQTRAGFNTDHRDVA
jgi:hypothetical protein